MVRTNGIGSRLFSVNLRKSVKLAGTSGSILLSKRLNGPEKKMRSFYILQRFCLVSGELLLLLLAVHHHNAFRGIKSSLMQHALRTRIMMIRTLKKLPRPGRWTKTQIRFHRNIIIF